MHYFLPTCFPLCFFSITFFFCIFFLYFYVILVFCFFGCFRQFCFCRNTLQNSYSEEKKYCDSRASNLIIQRLSLCLHDKRNRHTNKSHNYHLEKKRARKRNDKRKKKQRGGIVGQNVTFPQQVQKNQIDGTGTPCSSRDPIGPPFGCRLL